MEVSLLGSAPVEPGDMVYVWWRSDPMMVDALPPSLARASLGFWTTPVPHRPSQWARATGARLAESVFDLSGLLRAEIGSLDADGLRSLPRIAPRLYTVSDVSTGEPGSSIVRLQVTMRDDWRPRSASFLHRLAPGDRVRVWIMPHPNHVDLSQPGLAVVTGSGAAGVFAALRSGARDIDLVWGLGDKKLERWMFDELAEHERSGGLASLRLVRSPERVDEATREILARRGLSDASQIYVSGNEAAGAAVHQVLREHLGERALAEATASMRYINSS